MDFLSKIKLPPLYVQVLLAILLGGILGYFSPHLAIQMKPFADGFIKLVKMLIAPIIFCTIVNGVYSIENIKQVGRIGGKSILYFSILSAISLVLGAVLAHLFQPGQGMNASLNFLEQKIQNNMNVVPHVESFQEFLLNIIPSNIIDAFAKDNILQVLFFSLLFAIALKKIGEKAKPVINFIECLSHSFFEIIHMIMKVAPIGALGAMAFTIGKYGFSSLFYLSKLLMCFYLTCFVFIFSILSLILKSIGFNIFQFINYIKEEIFIVFGTCSSETVFPRMIEKLKALGCEKSVVGMVLPTGYSFNLDGTAIYLSMAAIFLAQATNSVMSIEEEIILLLVMMLSSKGAAGVVGSGFIVLTTTLSSIGNIPVESVAIILGIDRFMAEGRAVTNLIGNGVATLFVARWEGKLDLQQARQVLSHS